MPLSKIDQFITFDAKALSDWLGNCVGDYGRINVCVQERNGDVLPIKCLSVKRDENENPYIVVVTRDIDERDEADSISGWITIRSD